MAKHQANQRVLPVVFAGAGLPHVPTLTAEDQTYAERMFSWLEIGPLPEPEARRAVLLPARGVGCSIDPAALDFIVDYTHGYPYFLQDYGKVAWNVAGQSPITAADAPRHQRTGGTRARPLQPRGLGGSEAVCTRSLVHGGRGHLAVLTH